MTTIRGGPFNLSPGDQTVIENPAVGQQTLYPFVVVYNYSSYLLAVDNAGDQDWIQPGIAAAYQLADIGTPLTVTPELLAGLPVLTTTCQAVFYTLDEGFPEGFPLTLPQNPGTTSVVVVDTVTVQGTVEVEETTNVPADGQLSRFSANVVASGTFITIGGNGIILWEATMNYAATQLNMVRLNGGYWLSCNTSGIVQYESPPFGLYMPAGSTISLDNTPTGGSAVMEFGIGYRQL